VLIVVAIFGFVLSVRKAKNKRLRSMRYVIVAVLLTGLAYGGWISSETIYDRQVISSFVVLHGSSQAPKSIDPTATPGPSAMVK